MENEELQTKEVIKVYNVVDVLDVINLKNQEENDTLADIIKSMAHRISSDITANKTVSIPRIGCVRRNPVRAAILENKSYLSVMRHNMGKEEYKDYIRYVVRTKMKEVENIDAYKIEIKKIIARNRKKYDFYCKSYGRAYADAYIYCIYLCDIVPFDEEVQNQFDIIEQNG